ncbi:MAG: hypothetical protein FJW83_00715 [Actinobacteria bacterium]|nr:hypothetical protein [Actinomycetota bacterium]
MAPSTSSTKKLAKVARSSKGSSLRQRSDRTYPLSVLAIVLIGLVLVFYGRGQRASAQSTEPRVTKDHWHAAFGLYNCTTFNAPFVDTLEDRVGIHSHNDNVIHIHPTSSLGSGKRAVIGRFFDEVGLKVTDTKITLPDGSTLEEGVTECASGGTGTIVLAVWDSADDPSGGPRLVTTDIADERFVRDRMAFTLAFVPAGTEADVPAPESIPLLDQLTDVAPVTTTTAVGATTTTADAATTTTAAATTTTAG